MKRLLAMILGTLMIGALAVTATGCLDPNTVYIGGSTSVTPLMEKLAEAFEKKSSFKVNISESDSSAGITKVKNNTYEVGMVSKDVSDAELDVTQICLDGLVVIVNKQVATVDNVTGAQLKELYLNLTSFSDEIKFPISREEGSGTRDAFDGFIGIKNSTLPKDVKIFNSTSMVIQQVESDAAAIGYISLGSLKTGDSVKHKAVKYEDKEATIDNIKNDSYKLKRPFNLIVKKGTEQKEAVKSFLDFIASAEGKAIITANGYIL